MKFHVVTIFPGSLDSYVNTSMLRRAQELKKIVIKYVNPRDYSKDPHEKVDHRPYGGGPGMVMTAQPIVDAVAKLTKKANPKRKIILFSPSGKQFTNATAKTFAKKYNEIVFICGHYEGIDARVKKILKAEEYSVGPYVLTGGEIPALICIDSISRQIDGVLKRGDSLEETRVSTSEVYTRPEVFTYKGKNYKVPKVLLSGHQKKIDEWKAGKKGVGKA